MPRTKPNSENTVNLHAQGYDDFLAELRKADSEPSVDSQGKVKQHTEFEKMLFAKVVAKSHEEITDRDILELDLDMEDIDIADEDSPSLTKQNAPD